MLFDEKDAQTKMLAIVNDLIEKMKNVGSGKLDPNIIQQVSVLAYGATTSLQSLAKVIVEDAITYFVEVFDPGILADVEKALRESNLGCTVTIQGKNRIKVAFNPLTEEDRKSRLPIVRKLTEEARIRVRDVRHGIKKDIDGMEGVSEDDQKSSLEKLQKIVDEYIGKIDELLKKKETELMTI